MLVPGLLPWRWVMPKGVGSLAVKSPSFPGGRGPWRKAPCDCRPWKRMHCPPGPAQPTEGHVRSETQTRSAVPFHRGAAPRLAQTPDVVLR